MKGTKGFTLLELLLAGAGAFLICITGLAALTGLLEWQGKLAVREAERAGQAHFERVFRKAWGERLSHSRADEEGLEIRLHEAASEGTGNLKHLRFRGVGESGERGWWRLHRESAEWRLAFRGEDQPVLLEQYRFSLPEQIRCRKSAVQGRHGDTAFLLQLSFPDPEGRPRKIGIAVFGGSL